jgi:hypothetical protein
MKRRIALVVIAIVTLGLTSIPAPSGAAAWTGVDVASVRATRACVIKVTGRWNYPDYAVSGVVAVVRIGSGEQVEREVSTTSNRGRETITFTATADSGFDHSVVANFGVRVTYEGALLTSWAEAVSITAQCAYPLA